MFQLRHWYHYTFMVNWYFWGHTYLTIFNLSPFITIIGMQVCVSPLTTLLPWKRPSWTCWRDHSGSIPRAWTRVYLASSCGDTSTLTWSVTTASCATVSRRSSTDHFQRSGSTVLVLASRRSGILLAATEEQFTGVTMGSAHWTVGPRSTRTGKCVS